jgi:RNA polymerase sigma factor (sigma-70 family)
MASGPFKQVLQQLRTLVAGRSADAADDTALVQRFATAGDDAAFETIVRRHGAMVRNVCQGVLRNATDADDAFQATFLVLARKAGSFRRSGSLASWLHGIAYRTARKAQTLSARRRSHERCAMPETVATDPAARQELRPLVHEALQQLPERFRGPLVLCYLENKTVAEAAQVLGRPFGSMSWLLDRGKQLLRERLERRGVVLGAGGVTALLAAESATAALPAALATAAAQAAVRFVIGPTPAAGAAAAQSLAEGVLHDMFKRKLKQMTVALLALALVGSAAGVILQAGSQRPVVTAAAPLDTEPARPEVKEPADLAGMIRGRRVLVAFQAELPLNRPNPTQAQVNTARKELDDAIAAALQKAKVEVLKRTAGEPQMSWGAQAGPHMLLLDCTGQDPEQALKDFPYEWGALVFQDGAVQKAICSTKGKEPTTMVGKTWASHPFSRRNMDTDLERYRSFKGVKVDYHDFPMPDPDAPVGAGAVFASAELTPEKGTTLLEVFLRSEIGFAYPPDKK